nr:wax ester/triacylglycerol synthase family O-acyltransferase [Nocardioides perillae]
MAFLARETPATPMHNATVDIFDAGPDGFDHAGLLSLIEDRIAFVPRYRQRVVSVPGRLANPVWVDDPDFDLHFHVRRSALPRPGTHEQLWDLVSRIVSRPLDRHRPLWEVYVVEGLADGHVAVLSKSHQVLVDGVETVDLGQVLLDTTPEARTLETEAWHPRRRPSAARLVRGAVRDSLTSPTTVLDTGRATAGATTRLLRGATQRAGAVAGAVTGRRSEQRSPLHVELSEQRRFVTVATDLADYRRVREVHGGTVNDVVLATVAGGLRGWLMTRRESMGGLRRLRAVVPMSVIDDELEATSLGTQIAGHLVDLPIGEPSPVVRLHQVSYSLQAHRETGRAVAANRLAGIAGFAPTTFHALGSRVAAAQQRHDPDLSVTNVPGPQFPLYAAGARMVESYPVHPLLPGHALAIGVTSYDGKVFLGITADRDAVPDAETLAQCVREALEELVDAASADRPRAPRGRTPVRPPRPDDT